MVAENDSGNHPTQGQLDDAEVIELRRRIARLRPERRDQLSNWLMEDKLTELSTELDNALRIFDDANFDFETGPFGKPQDGD